MLYVKRFLTIFVQHYITQDLPLQQHDRRVVSNHRQIDCFFNSFQPQNKENIGVPITVPLWEESNSHQWDPLNNAESSTMSSVNGKLYFTESDIPCNQITVRILYVT